MCVCVCVGGGGRVCKLCSNPGSGVVKNLCVGPIFPGGVGVVFQLQSMGEPGFLLEQP